MNDTGSSSNIGADDDSQNITEQVRDPILEGIDYFSQLPEDMLFHVLSFLNLKESVALSTLQKKWKNICAKIPNLNFDEFEVVKVVTAKELFCNQHNGIPTPESQCCSMHLQQLARRKFTEIVDRTLLVHSGWPIENLNLCFYYHVSNEYSKRIHSWLQFAFTNSIKNLKLEFAKTDPLNRLTEEDLRQRGGYTKPNPLFVFPSDCSGPKGLETLNLKFCRLSATRFTAFDSLRSLLLKYVKIIDGSIAELVRECPVLEDLTLDSCNIPKAFLVSTEDIMIKRLAVLYTDTNDRLDIDISTPYLLKLEIVEVNALSVSIRNASQLVDATLSIVLLVNKPGVVRGDPFNSMLAGLRHCRGLTLNTYMPWMLHTDPYLPEELQTPLENLNDLIMVAGLLQIELDRVSFLLRSCPNLEVLIISLHEPWPMGSVIDETSTAYRIEEDGHWETQTKPFPCLLHSLRRITVMKLKGSTIELQMIKFLLTNAKVLEKMVIYLDEMREEASKTPQRTIICRQQRKNIRTFLRFVSTYFRDKVTVINPNKK